MRAISVLRREAGTSTRWCLAAAALRMRVKKSAMGSVCMFLLSSSCALPTGFDHAGNFSPEGHAAEADAAHFKLADISAGAAANTTAVARADLELRLLEFLDDFRGTRHQLAPSLGPRRGTPRPFSSSRPCSSFFAVVVKVMFMPLILSTRV